MFHLRRTFRATISRADHWHPSPSCRPVAAAPVEEQTDSLERPVLPTRQATAKTFAPTCLLKTNNPKQAKLIVRAKRCSVPDSLFLLQNFFPQHGNALICSGTVRGQHGVSTGSGSDRVSVAISGTLHNDPVATETV